MISPAQILAAAPDVAIGAVLLAAWFAPHLVGVDKLAYGLQLMLLEFIVIHSAAFMGLAATHQGSATARVAVIIGLGILYSLFVGSFARAFGDWWMLWAFWLLILNRLLSAILAGGMDDRAKQAAAAAGWGLSVVLYIGWVIGTTFLPIPRLGIAAGMVWAGEGQSGLWVDEPHRLLAAGAGYFLSQAYFELRTPAWFEKLRAEAGKARIS